MIGLEQWRAAVGAWHAGSTRAYRRYVNGRRRIVCNWQKLLFHTASIHYSVTWFIAVLFAFVSGSVASALGFNVDCRYSQSLCTAVKSPGKVCQDSTVRSCAADLCRLLKSATPSLVSMLRLLSALRWLLIVAGDVELNPGPVSQELEMLLETTDASVLMKDDIFSVYREVLDLAPNWMDVGLMLGLRNADLKGIRTTYHDPRDCLKETLKQWLKQAYNTEKSGLPTWKKMAEVTAHPVVGNNPALAATLARNHQGTTQTAGSNPPQAKPSIDSSSTVVSRHAQYLRYSYQAQIPTFLTLQWPPPPTRKIFNLAMIRGQNIRYGPIDEEMVRLTLRGRVRDILFQKRPVEMKDILAMDSAKREVILIEGAPGSGKSTLAWHVCQTWQSGKLFQNYRSVVYVQLRDPKIQSAKTIEDLIPAESRDQAKKVMEEFRSCRGQDLLIVLDGWDELPSDLHTKSIFEKLIAFPETLNVHFSAVIITSRPIASSDLYHIISSRVEILGFTPSEVKEYFTEALRGESQAVQKLQDQLRESPMVECSCYLPLNAAIVSHLFLAQNYSLPTTVHGVFTLLVVCCLRRHVAKQEREQEMQYITSLDNLPMDIKPFFKDVYTLAYHGVMDNRATFPAEYLESRGLPKISETLGLIQGVESFTSLNSSQYFYFLHLSVQELLASFYISKLPGKEQVVVFNKIFGEPRFAAVFRFYAAFTKLETEGIREIVARIVRNKQKTQTIYLLHGLYEAQTLSLCQFVYSQLGGKLDLSNTTLSPVDCLAVGYFISCICLTGSGEFEADLARCSIDSYRVSFLIRELSKCTRSAHTHQPKLAVTDTGVSSHLELTLNLEDNQVGDEGTALLCGGNVIHLLKTLNLENNGISDEGGRAIAEGLKVNRSLTTLDLGNNGISDEGGIAIAESLKVNQSLTTLDLDNNGLSYNAVSTIAEALKVNQSLAKLFLGGNGISDEGGRAITEGLKVNQSLTTLLLSYNELSDSAGIAFAEGLKVNHSLTELDLSNNDISDEGGRAIAAALRVNQSLTTLSLYSNGMSHEFKSLLTEEFPGRVIDLPLRFRRMKKKTSESVGDGVEDRASYSQDVTSDTGDGAKLKPPVPQITVEPDSLENVTPGKPAEFVVKATGKNLTYTWHRQTTKQLLSSDKRVFVGNMQILRIKKVESSDEGYYVCTIRNPTGGSVETNPVQLTTGKQEEIDEVQIPQIKKQPSSKENVTPGENVQFVVEGTGMKLSYTWHHQTSKDASKVKVGENNPTLHIDKVKSDDEGYYTCTITNPAGHVETDSVQLTTRLKKEDYEEDKKLLDEEMKKGYISARFLKIIFTGAAGVGKTHAVCLLCGDKPPDPEKRESTDCTNKAVTLLVDATNDEKWEKIDINKKMRIIAEGILRAANENPKMEKPKQHVTPPPESPKPHAEPKSETEQTTQPPSPAKQEQKAQSQEQDAQSTAQESKQEQVQQQGDPKSPLETQQASSQALKTESDLVKRIHDAIVSGKFSGEVLEIKWVYAVDTGGQPPFHELLSAFIKGTSACAFVFKLSERLDHRPQVEYWVDGTKVGEPFPHPLSNRQILEQSIQTIEALPSLLDEHTMSPLLLVIGTHRDEQDKCEDETLEDKERTLHDIMDRSGCKCQYNTHSGEQRIVFDVNAKNPEQRDRDIAAALRREIANIMPEPKQIPLRHYGLELELEHLATTENKGVINMKECCAIGDRLNFNEKELKAALKFLHSVNVLLYYPEVKEVEELIFCDPLFLMKIISKVVQHIHKGATTEWMESRNRGSITIGQLDTEEFRSCLRSKIFTFKCLFKLFDHLLIVAKVKGTDQEYFMPCLLDTLDQTTRISRQKSEHCSPLVFQFYKGRKSVYAPSGLFSALVAFLLSSWTIEVDSEIGDNIYRNIITFRSSLFSAHITLMNFPTRFVVFAKCCLYNRLKEIRSFILDGLKVVKKVRNFEQVNYKEAFTCKCDKNKESENPHLADIHIKERSWYCPLDSTITGHLEISELAWHVEVPQILQEPSSQENVTPGKNIQFVVEATGMNLSYTWHHQTSKDASKVKVGENNEILHIKEVKSDDEGYYTCTISNPGGVTVDTKPARLTTMQIPRIKKQPSSEENVTPGENVRFAVEASGMKLSYTWHHHTSKQPLSSEKKLVGEEQTLHIKKVKSDDEGYYTCTISNVNPAGHVETVPVRLTTTPQITDKPHDVKNAAPGKPAELVVKAIGKDLTYTWHHQTAKDASKVEVGENDPTLRIDKVKSHHEGYYTCTISNPTGGTVETTPARLTTTPEIIKKPRRQENVTLGSNVDFVVEATGMNLSYTWHHQTSKDASKVKVGEDNPTLCIDNVKSADEGCYTCTISNPTGGTVETTPAQLKITFCSKYGRLLLSAGVVVVIAVLIGVWLKWPNNTALSSQTPGQPEATPGPGSQGCTEIGGYLEASHAIESDFSKWRLLGEELGITPTELNRIDREQDGELSKLRETIQEWWRGVPADKFCWEKLIAALQTLKKINLAERISKQYIE